MRALVLAAAAAAAAVLFVVLRPDDDERRVVDTTTPATRAETRPFETTELPTTAPRAPEPVRPDPTAVNVELVLRDGRVVRGPRRMRVMQGRRVRIVVRSNRPDRIHLHGYDILRPVGPTGPTILAFRATAPGRFELELEDAHIHVAELEVRP